MQDMNLTGKSSDITMERMMNKWTDIQALCPINGKTPDYQACLDAFPALEYAKLTPQDPRYHGEGDVFTHTVMVVEELLSLPQYQTLDREHQITVFLAALLHDIAKYSTTVIDPDSGRISQPGHSKRGSVDARISLWDLGVPFEIREAICRLIAVHQVPFFALEGSRSGKTPEFLVRKLSWELDVRLLALLAEADMRGRICPDKQGVIDNIELFREIARDENCFDRPYVFVDAHTRLSYFRGADVHPHYPLFQEPGSKVTVMCGLPASGKNTWVELNRKNLPVVSFDDSREELGLRHGKAEGVVAHHATDRAKALLRDHAPFVWNATHLSQQMRDKTLNLLYAYGAEVNLVYLEQPRTELLKRNSKRDSTLTNKRLESMVLRWEIPTPTEAHSVSYEVQ